MPYDSLLRSLVNTYDEKTILFFRLYYIGSESSQRAYVAYMLKMANRSEGKRERSSIYIGEDYFALGQMLHAPSVDIVGIQMELLESLFLSYEPSTRELFKEHFENTTRNRAEQSGVRKGQCLMELFHHMKM